jgi:hypothetical protein
MFENCELNYVNPDLDGYPLDPCYKETCETCDTCVHLDTVVGTDKNWKTGNCFVRDI